jgi:hypothetical protein
MIPAQDRTILRELAKSYRELAEQDINRERINRIRDMHSLKTGRPPVWIDEIPWHEMDIDGQLVLHCESEEGKTIEDYFRKVLYRWKYIQADMVVENAFYVSKAYTVSGIGITVKEQSISHNIKSNIASHHYEDQLDTEDKVAALKLPLVTAYPEVDKKKLEEAEELFGDILPVKLRGHEIYYCPWDKIARFRGVEPCFLDMLDNPDLIHATLRKFTDITVSHHTQMADLGLLDFNTAALHCTPPYTNDLPAEDYDGGKPRLKDLWFRGMAQLFGAASPAMQDEYDLQYMKPFMEKCGLSYYGCCEPLDLFIPYLKKVKNLRKIGVSPWANVKSSAEQIGGDYVFARKPNPALVSGNFNAGALRQEITETVEACIENKCPYELVLKDISTVTDKPQNLIDWAKTVSETLDIYYR